MSQFTKPADLRMLDNYRWQLLTQFEYYIGDEPGDEVIVVPEGTVTDLASVPRLLWAIFPPYGRYAKAAIIHDYLYDQAIKTKSFADKTFYEAMGVLGVPQWRRTLMYWAVRLFGRGNYCP